MKKIILTCICTLAVAGAAIAQGTVNFGQFIPTVISAQTNSTANSPLFGGGAAVGGAVGATALNANAFYFELLWTTAGASAPASLAALGAWTDSGYYALNSTGSAGRLIAGNGTTGTAISGLPPGTTASMMLVGWSANLGTTWSAAYGNLSSWQTAQSSISGNAFLGITTVGQITPAGTGTPGVTLFGTGVGQINSPNTQLYLVPVTVPEPSTIALAGLGGLAMLALRRKK